MPTLDFCINSLFEPGNIGSSSGAPPTVIRPGMAGAMRFSPATANLVLSPTAPTMVAGGHRNLAPAAANLALSGTAPTLAGTANFSPEAAAANLVLSGTAPTVAVTTVSAEAAAFLARTSGLDATHTNAYITLIDGLVADGVWAKLDFLHIYATQDSTTALLNLKSTSFNGTAHGSPTFTADRGFTGVNASTTVYIDTGFNPTSGSPQYTQNSAHLSVWNLTNTTSGSSGVGSQDASNNGSYILTKSGSSAFFRVNTTAFGLSVGNADATGHYIANRSNSTSVQGYKNGSLILSNTLNTSIALLNQNFYGLAINSNGTASGVGHQIAAISIGSSMNSTEEGNFYTRMRTYMTAVGVVP